MSGWRFVMSATPKYICYEIMKLFLHICEVDDDTCIMKLINGHFGMSKIYFKGRESAAVFTMEKSSSQHTV